MSKVEVAMYYPEIEGYEYTGERRIVKKGEWFLGWNLTSDKEEAMECRNEMPTISYPILRPKKWRAANGYAYYCLGISEGKFFVNRVIDSYRNEDNCRYVDGNYEKTEEVVEQTMLGLIEKLKNGVRK